MSLESALFKPKFALLWMSLFLVVGFILNLGGFPLFDVDEGAFSEATREMLASGNWAATYLNGEPRYDKPIFTYWMQGISVSMFGLNEIGLRLHSVIASLLWATAINRFTREFLSKQHATLAVLIFSSTFWITIIGKAATADAIFNLFICLTLFDIYRYSQSPTQKTLFFVWLWIGLGILTKGPVALLIPILVSLPFFLSRRQGRVWLNAAFSLRGWITLVLVVLPWLYLVWQDQGWGFFEGFILEHNLQRFSSTKEGHGGIWYYYLIALPLIALPYSGCLFVLAANLGRLLQGALERFLSIWFIVVFVLVTLSETQLPHYVLYGYTPLVILIAKMGDSIKGQSWQLIFPLLFLGLIGTIAGAVLLDAVQLEGTYESIMLETAKDQFDLTFLSGLSVAIASTVALFWIKTHTLHKLIAAGMVQTLFVSLLLLPVIGEIQQGATKQAGIFAKENRLETVSYGINQPSFSVYAQQIVSREQLPNSGQILFTRIDKTAELANIASGKLDILYSDRGIQIVRLKPID